MRHLAIELYQVAHKYTTKEAIDNMVKVLDNYVEDKKND